MQIANVDKIEYIKSSENLLNKPGVINVIKSNTSIKVSGDPDIEYYKIYDEQTEVAWYLDQYKTILEQILILYNIGGINVPSVTLFDSTSLDNPKDKAFSGGAHYNSGVGYF